MSVKRVRIFRILKICRRRLIKVLIKLLRVNIEGVKPMVISKGILRLTATKLEKPKICKE
jgi:hypothetical protein